jgi:hypothetical protein
MLWKRLNLGSKNIPLHKISQIAYFLNHTTLEILMALISQILLEIREPVDHATQYLSPRLLNLD